VAARGVDGLQVHVADRALAGVGRGDLRVHGSGGAPVDRLADARARGREERRGRERARRSGDGRLWVAGVRASRSYLFFFYDEGHRPFQASLFRRLPRAHPPNEFGSAEAARIGCLKGHARVNRGLQESDIWAARPVCAAS
jgi:hypothetical protein